MHRDLSCVRKTLLLTLLPWHPHHRPEGSCLQKAPDTMQGHDPESKSHSCSHILSGSGGGGEVAGASHLRPKLQVPVRLSRPGAVVLAKLWDLLSPPLAPKERRAGSPTEGTEALRPLSDLGALSHHPPPTIQRILGAKTHSGGGRRGESPSVMRHRTLKLWSRSPEQVVEPFKSHTFCEIQ